MSTRALRVASAGLALALFVSSGCASTGDADQRRLSVLAASSLTDAFSTLAARFERTYGVDVRLSFAGSSSLAQQVVDGAPADVVATADQESMALVSDAGLAATDPTLFATNTLVIVTPRDNPAGITTVRSLADPDVSVALCAPEVPCGRAAADVLRVDRVQITPVTLEPDVRSVLAKVRLGEVDAGIVYVTDARSAGSEVRTVPLRNAATVVSRYPLAALRSASEPVLARQFVRLVLSPAGQQVLHREGFGTP